MKVITARPISDAGNQKAEWALPGMPRCRLAQCSATDMYGLYILGMYCYPELHLLGQYCIHGIFRKCYIMNLPGVY